uniref:Uncharacterized protein n=1 Tax=Aegilops tauschii subsp. strangulata TaxID=200361 RepID=A0A453C4H6_AEGTS
MFSTTKSRVKIIVLFVPKLSGLEAYITMLFTQMLPKYVFLTTFFHGSELPWCLYINYQVRGVYYHAIYKHYNKNPLLATYVQQRNNRMCCLAKHPTIPT